MKSFIHDKRRYIRLYAKKKISRSQKNVKLVCHPPSYPCKEPS